MTSKSSNGGGLFSSLKSSLWNNGKLPKGVEVISPEGDTADAAVEATKGRLKPEERVGLWNMLKKHIGMDITYLGFLPIYFLEPRSQLQRGAESMEYSHLLDQVNECDDPYMQLVYASSWSMSFLYAIRRTFKTFNPILGETCEFVNYNGITYIGEQVSHHPPVEAVHAENEHFVLDSTTSLRTKLLGNSLDIYLGTRRRCCPRVYPSSGKTIQPYIFGRMWISFYGDLTLTNLTTGVYVVLRFQPSGWFSGGRFEVDGCVYNAAKEPKILMSGKWTKSMSYQSCDKEGKPKVPDIPVKDKYNFTYFAHKVNSFDTAPRRMLASDSRLRPDRYALEKGDLSKVSHEKNSLEVRQRKERIKREANGDKFTPKWFDLTKQVYDEHRETVISTGEVDVQPTEIRHIRGAHHDPSDNI
ncbi:hypothetical protein MKX03_002019 [Papaver bracteatum]|nr:hypothetical protein MKX03_002019 [Papaver bracteatum]